MRKFVNVKTAAVVGALAAPALSFAQTAGNTTITSVISGANVNDALGAIAAAAGLMLGVYLLMIGVRKAFSIFNR